MTISVIIPVFQQAQYLPDAIESCFTQTIAPHEVIVINDGSNDGSLEIAQKYGVKVINQVNKGLPSARNTGIMNATGDYILPLDADDILQDNAIEIISKYIEETNADIIAPSFKTFGTENYVVELADNPTIDNFRAANYIGYFSAIRRSKLLEVGGYNPRMTWGWEDYDLWIDLLKRGAVIKTLKEVLILYRTKAHSMIHVANEHAEELTIQMHKNHPEVYEN